MKFPSIKRAVAGTILGLALSLGGMSVVAQPVLAAVTIQEEGAIYAANVTNGDTTFTKNGVNAKAGDTVAFEVYYHNLEAPSSGKDALNVRIKVNVPGDYATLHTVSTKISGDNFDSVNATTTVNSAPDSTQMQFVPGSITWRHNTGTNASPNWATDHIGDEVVTGANGAIVDQIEHASNNFSGTIVFKAKLVGKQTPPPATPIYTCDMFDISADKDRTVKITDFSTTAKNGATFKNAVVSWGDKSDDFTSATLIGKTHQYAKDGTYTVTATAHFTVDGKDVVAPATVNCSKSVTFKGDTPPTVTPPVTPPTNPSNPAAPTALVNTGAGSVIGLFAAATAVGAAAYRKVLSRRLSEV